MNRATGTAISCPMCGRRYPSPRRVKGGTFPCWCGHQIAMPGTEAEHAEPLETVAVAATGDSPSADTSATEDSFQSEPPIELVPELELDPQRDAPPEMELAPEPSHATTPRVHPSPAAAIPAPEPAGTARAQVPNELLAKYGLPPASPSRYLTEEDDEGSRFTNTVLPVILIAVGAVLWLGQAGYVARDPTQSLPRIAALVVLGLVLNVAVTTAGCFISAMLMSLNFGAIGRMVLKLAAIAIIAGALGSLIVGLDRDHFSITGMVVAWHMVILIYFVCFCTFFPFDLQENLATVAIIGLMQAMALLMIWTA